MNVRFSVEGDPTRRTHEAVRLAAPWNGWAVPVVTRATVVEMLEGLAHDEAGNAPQYRSVWWMDDRGVFTITMPDDDEPSILAPDADGLYTFDLGWVWDVVETDTGDADHSDPDHADGGVCDDCI